MSKEVEVIIKKFHETNEMAKSISQENFNQIASNYKEIILDKTVKGGSYQLSKIKEESIYKLGSILSKFGKKAEIIELSKNIREIFQIFPVIVSAKIVRILIEELGKIENALAEQIQLCLDSIEWAKEGERTFLKQRIELKLASLYYAKKDYVEAIKILTKLVREVRKLDDKSLLVEIFLLESKVQFSLKNVPKAKSSLIAARNAGESIYIPPVLQGDLDTQSGIIYSAESDYETAFSYFFEAFESYDNMGIKLSVFCLKYMLLCKILAGTPEEILNILANKKTLKYVDAREVCSIKAISQAYQHKSLHEFQTALGKYEKELVKDFIISQKISFLYDTLLEQHLLRIIKPFSRVQITHIAKLIQLDKSTVEKKLSIMILDKKLNGILDQGNDCLITFVDQDSDDLLETATGILDQASNVVDSLFDKAKTLEA